MFCEEESKEGLIEVLRGGNIQEPVVLKSNFLMVSLRRALKCLMDKGDAHMIQEDCAKWLLKNFRIRKGEELKEFKIYGSRDVFGKALEQKKRSQIKFENWYKK